MADRVIDVEIRTNTTGVRTLRQELRETVNELHNLEVGSAEFDRLNAHAAGLRDRMAEVNEQINAIATGSPFERVSNSIGEMGAGLAALDFDRVRQGANLFAQSARGITFGDAIKSVKQLGSTFLTIGKAILTNPLFLIAGIITLIGVAIVKLLDKMGVLKVIFEAVGDAIGWVVQQFKDLLDWIGLTDFAGEDAAEKLIERNEKQIESNNKKSKALVGALDFEINIRKIRGEDTEKYERKKLKALIETSRQEMMMRYQMANAIAKLHGADSDEYKEALKNIDASRDAYIQAQRDIKLFEAQTAEDKKKERKKSEEEQQKTIDDANKKAQAKRQANVAQAKKEREDEEAKRKEAEKKAEAERIARAQEEANRVAELQKTIQAIENEYEDARLTQYERDKNAVYDKYFAIIEMAKVAGEEIATLEAAQQAELDAIDKAEIETKKANQLEYRNWLTQYETDERARLVNDLTLKNEEAKAKLDEFKAQGIIDEQAYQDQLKAIEQKKIDDLAEYDKKKAKEQFEAKMNAAAEYASAGTGLLTTLGDLSVAIADKDVKSQEKAARRKFAIDKAAALVTAGINTALAITKAAPNPALMILAGVTGAAAIATIASKQFNSGASSSSASIGSSAVNEAQAPSAPTFSMFGTGGNANTVSASGQPNTNQNITVTAVVSETEMTNTQHQAMKFKQSASL